jgi:hypothetical protein
LKSKKYFMPNEEHNDSIGGPEPVDPGAVESVITRVVVALAVTAGGIVAFAALTAPVQCRGATRSSRLRWEERQQQIEEAIKAEHAETNADGQEARKPPQHL